VKAAKVLKFRVQRNSCKPTRSAASSRFAQQSEFVAVQRLSQHYGKKLNKIILCAILFAILYIEKQDSEQENEQDAKQEKWKCRIKKLRRKREETRSGKRLEGTNLGIQVGLFNRRSFAKTPWRKKETWR
jgi:hypothetical protein